MAFALNLHWVALNCTEYGASKLHRMWCTESRLLNNETQVPLFLSTQNSLQHSTANTWVAMGGVFTMCVESCQPTSKVPFPQHRVSPVQQLHPPRLEVRSLLRSQPCGKLAVCIRVYQSVSECITVYHSVSQSLKMLLGWVLKQRSGGPHPFWLLGKFL